MDKAVEKGSLDRKKRCCWEIVVAKADDRKANYRVDQSAASRSPLATRADARANVR
jgi:hypothetical protein